MTAGDPLHIGRLCPERACTSKAHQPYAVLIGRKLVESGIVQSAYIRNLAEGALHGAAVPALCVDKFLSRNWTSLGFGCADLHCLHGRYGAGQERTWLVNSTHAERLREDIPSAIYDQPVDVALVEFSINGIEFVDVLLKRIRAKYPRALILYIDHFRLLDWRIRNPHCQPDVNKSGGVSREISTPSAPCSFDDLFVLRHDFHSAPGCTAQLQRWLDAVGAEFFPLRLHLSAAIQSIARLAVRNTARLRRSSAENTEYRALLRYFHGDKYHLSEFGHAAIADGAWPILQAMLEGIRAGPEIRPSLWNDSALKGHNSWTGPTRKGESHRTSHHASNCDAVPIRDADEVVSCYYWYRMGQLDARLTVDGAATERRGHSFRVVGNHSVQRGWALRPSVTGSAGEGHGKWAFELVDPEHRWRSSVLNFRIQTSSRNALVRIGYMLHCCRYGMAEISLDGKPSIVINASSAGFPHHVMQVVRVGILPETGEHNVSVCVVAGNPNEERTGETHQFRVTWLHVSAPLHGLQDDSEYRLTSVQ